MDTSGRVVVVAMMGVGGTVGRVGVGKGGGVDNDVADAVSDSKDTGFLLPFTAERS